MKGWTSASGVYLIAEIGGNHEGDFEYATELTALACSSGVDAVKFQIYTGDSLVSPVEDFDRNHHFKRFELTPDQHISLARQCKKEGVSYLASVWNPEVIKWIDPWLEFYKIGSGDLTAWPMIQAISAIGKPIVLSTGLASLGEIIETVEYLQSMNKMYKDPKNLALLQCTSMYPIADSDVNLRVMDTMRHEFGVAVGYSDHTVGTMAVETAVAMGAEIIEMHFTDDRSGKNFRDHQVSFTKDEIIQLIAKIKKIKTLQGTGNKQPLPVEIDAGHVKSFRRAVYPARALPEGTILSKDDLTILRPNIGIDARMFESLLGRQIRTAKDQFVKMDWDDLVDE